MQVLNRIDVSYEREGQESKPRTERKSGEKKPGAERKKKMPRRSPIPAPRQRPKKDGVKK